MTQIKLLPTLLKSSGIAILSLLISFSACGWSIYSSQSQDQKMGTQIAILTAQLAKQDVQIASSQTQSANQSTQLAKQDVQIASSQSQDRKMETQIANQLAQLSLQTEANRNASIGAMAAATIASSVDQSRALRSTDGDSFAPTATALAIQAAQAEATRQAIGIRQKQIEATQTAIAQPSPVPVVMIRADDVVSKLRGEDGELERILGWWRVDDYGKKEGQLNPSSFTANETCFGLAWNTNEYGYHKLIVFQKPSVFTFAEGGWYTKVCILSNIQIAPRDVGRIQADWLGKCYGIDNQPWEVIVK